MNAKTNTSNLAAAHGANVEDARPTTGETPAVKLGGSRTTPAITASSASVVLDDNSPKKPIQEDKTKRWDYVSPGLSRVRPERLFPNLMVGNTNIQPWEYLRREVPHTWYVDKRFPRMGFLSRDEAAIVHNTAKMFKGKPALEVGCWRGWSTAHLLSAGVHLDVVDIILDDPDAAQELASIAAGLKATKRTTFNPGSSHIVVPELAARTGTRWNLMFIDGDHEAPAPANDAFLCSQFAADDALMIFHDLASPAVADALGVMRREGWNTVVYQTMQILGVAWRGDVVPVPHTPDPKVEWDVPDHLKTYKLAHESEDEYIERLKNHLPVLVDQGRSLDELRAQHALLSLDRDNWKKSSEQSTDAWAKELQKNNENWHEVSRAKDDYIEGLKARLAALTDETVVALKNKIKVANAEMSAAKKSPVRFLLKRLKKKLFG